MAGDNRSEKWQFREGEELLRVRYRYHASPGSRDSTTTTTNGPCLRQQCFRQQSRPFSATSWRLTRQPFAGFPLPWQAC